MAESSTGWRRCSACKKPIDFESIYYTCSVSTCNRKRTAMYFCDVSCWEVHLPIARHREAWAEEERAPSAAQAAREAAAEASGAPVRKPKRIIAEPKRAPEPQPARASSTGASASDAQLEVLIVASRLKDYIRAISGYNTSDRVLEPLSEIVREVCQRAIRNAEADGRKTVLDRDIPSA
jgi:histone H3/H4